MQVITDNIYIEDQYPGATLGAIATSRGLIQIDAPPSLEDARSWRASLMNLTAGPERVLINLDSHPDRTIGARAMDCTVIAHEKTAAIFRSRPTTFKAVGEETGADWESIAGLGSVRWAPPEISFGQQMTLHWGDRTVLLEHHPGPTSGAIWVVIPAEKIVFVGDLVLKGQPPFLANANLTAWLESLNKLTGPKYKGYKVISSRGGPVSPQAVKAQIEFIKLVQNRLDKLASKRSHPNATDKLVEPLLSKFKAPAARQKQYAQRLRHGLHQCYARRYHPSSRSIEY